ncbi:MULTISPECIES: LLM class flavin-dependent oxidoreductase [unclassified Pseudomonas]|uniref:LLM class flavin-dependent oxidoreductase n=1 Tax=unclassified Pseudomonas TaxID=196821 RepID=UPI002ACB0B84|nr:MULTISPECIES: LLM class flavin-dependent oxidoreductase [unclassified Pseudomonas]MEB0039152.1 LLM class flavin-dependent oxidoreductase [Pseudomonas sp. MH10]MEB0091953.1 LLM class flavin-dependent oxidoreductase [Pseudomonas sp. CCI4.2]MEB0121111.1 LLM class flavin-dependent oxidoreductase [Pseudomonas sp. CCI1.2]WPX55108.1 LLM class flavin-dependent oxidoreductase [Pseudomonas sp. CCI4.2]WPX62552.1 LLM class flavin-dependent oxidoreductase [Pseudomonas sp. MH10]
MKRLADVKISTLDLVPVRQDAGPAQSLRNSLDLAQHVEKLGYNRFWVAEHHNMDGIASSATSVLIGYLAGGTSTIRVGAGGVMLPNHAPLVIAEQFGTLASLYPGRIDLGLGRAPGSDQMTARALRRERSGSADDFPEDVTELLRYLGPRTPDQRVIAVPGTGTNVPVWLLGSSLFSAQLAGERGLPYAFASHFAPRYMHEAIRVYRAHFKPSIYLDEPYVMLGVPLVAADTDEHADYLATSLYQRILSLMRGQSLVQKAPVKSMEGLWLPHEREAVADFLGLAMVGSALKIRAKLEVLVEQTQADELIFTCDMYEHADRLRSYEILAQTVLG